MKKLLIVLMALALVLCGTAFAESEPVKLAWIVQDMANESQSYACRIAEEMAGDYGFEFTYYDQAGDIQKCVDAVTTCIAEQVDADGGEGCRHRDRPLFL